MTIDPWQCMHRLTRLLVTSRGGCTNLAIWLLLASICIWLSAAVPTSAAPSQQTGTIVRCNPASVAGYPNQLLTLEMYVQDVQGLYGADLNLSFDPAVAQVVDEDVNIPGVQIQPLGGFLVPGFILFKEADNTAGQVHYAATQLNPMPPASGSGSVARIRFQPLQVDSFTASYSRYDLADRNGILIPATAETCSVSWQCYWADLNCSCSVDAADIGSAAGKWSCTAGQTCYSPNVDRNSDGVIDIEDIMLFTAQWGWACPSS